MLKIIEKITRKFKRKELDIGYKLWPTENCYICGKPYNKNSFWAEFREINGVVWSVPVCDACSAAESQRAEESGEIL